MKLFQIKKRIYGVFILLFLLGTVYYFTPSHDLQTTTSTDLEKLYKGNSKNKPEKVSQAQAQLTRELGTLREKERLRELRDQPSSDLVDDAQIDATKPASKQPLLKTPLVKQFIPPPNLLQPYKEAPPAKLEPLAVAPMVKATKATALGKIKAIPINVKNELLDAGDALPQPQRKPIDAKKPVKGVEVADVTLSDDDEGTSTLDINGKPIVAASIVLGDKLEAGHEVAAIDPALVGSKRYARYIDNLNMTTALNTTAITSSDMTSEDMTVGNQTLATATILPTKGPVPQVMPDNGASVTD